MFVCVCVCVYVRVCIHVCMFVCMHVCVCASASMHVFLSQILLLTNGVMSRDMGPILFAKQTFQFCMAVVVYVY